MRSGGGSVYGKAKNTWGDFAGAHSRYMLRQFCPFYTVRLGTNDYGPSQLESAFERRFRLPRVAFDKIFSAVTEQSDYLVRGLKPDACGRLGINPLILFIFAFRMLAYAIPSNFCDDTFDILKTTAQLCCDKFCIAMITCLAAEYLRYPTAKDLIRIEKKFRDADFPGCIGAVDCAGWTWKNCPKALHGTMVGKYGKHTLRLEAVCDLDLWCWHFQFGFSGAMNDINIMNAIEHFNNVLSGAFPSKIPSYSFAGGIFNWYSNLADGIYPR